MCQKVCAGTINYQNVYQSENGKKIVFSHSNENEQTAAIYNTNESHKQNIEQKKLDTKECRLYDCFYIRIKGRLHYGVTSLGGSHPWGTDWHTAPASFWGACHVLFLDWLLTSIYIRFVKIH